VVLEALIIEYPTNFKSNRLGVPLDVARIVTRKMDVARIVKRKMDVARIVKRKMEVARIVERKVSHALCPN
jgi:hypothetical protein